MAATTPLAAFSSCSGLRRPTAAACSSGVREGPSSESRRRIVRAPAAGQQRRVRKLGSGFLGQAELRGSEAAGREAGRRGGRNRVGAARAGLPVVSSIPVLGPVLNAFVNPVVLFILYAAGASRFWSGFDRTSYSNTAPTKVTLTALWPALFIASAAFRSNFQRAVK